MAGHTLGRSLALTLCMVVCFNVHAAEKRLDRTFQVTPGGQLTVDADGSSIEVMGGDASQVVVHIVVKASERELETVDLSAEADSNGVAVRAKRRASGWFGFWGNSNAAVKVVVPRRYDLKLDTSGGSIKVSGVQGNAQGKSSGGSVRVDRVQGPVRMVTSGGSIDISDITGNVDIRTSGGSISVLTVKGDVKANTSGGSIRLDAIEGATTAATSGGGVTASKITGAADLQSSGGGVKAQAIDGSMKISSSGGDIHADLIGTNRGISASTTGGSIVIRVPRNISGTLDAATSGGSVTSELPVTTTEARDRRLAGTINGGGSEIRARTSGGSIRLQARD